MAESTDFQALIARIRTGDAAAAATLLREYEREVRRMVRFKLKDPKLRRTMDSIDICQSVMADFFIRVGMGQFDLDNPQDLIGLLVTMAKNRVIQHARKQNAAKNGGGRHRIDDSEIYGAVADSGESPESLVANRELLQEVHRRLPEDIRQIASERANGREWADLAQERGMKADALRRRYTRAIDEVRIALGFEPDEEDDPTPEPVKISKK